MAADITPASDKGGGNAKYAVVGLLLVAGAVGVWLATRSAGSETEPVASDQPPPAEHDAGSGPVVQPSQPDLYIPEPEPDAGPQVDAGRPAKRIVYRYIQEPGEWECSGDIPAAQVRAVVATNERQVRNCYERGLKRNNQMQGNVTLSLKIGRVGNVEGVRVGGSLGDSDVFSCVRSLASSWRFPAPSGGPCAVVRAPFNFTPQGR